jgi:hypothetical protein
MIRVECLLARRVFTRRRLFAVQWRRCRSTKSITFNFFYPFFFFFFLLLHNDNGYLCGLFTESVVGCSSSSLLFAVVVVVVVVVGSFDFFDFLVGFFRLLVLLLSTLSSVLFVFSEPFSVSLVIVAVVVVIEVF